MKYLVILLSIVIAITAASYLLLRPEQPETKKDVLVTINGHDISRSDIREEGKVGSHHESGSDFLDSVISKQLLIEEAQRLNIDKEPSFRKELKEYYEQSLIKVLVERKSATLPVRITDQAIDAYLNGFGKTYTFVLLKTPELPTPDSIRKKGQSHSARYEDLSENLRLALSTLKPGETAMAFETGNENTAILLEKIEGTTVLPAAINRDRIRTTLEEYQRRQLINNWIRELRKKASVTIHTQKEQP